MVFSQISNHQSHPIMIQGTASHVGKSVLVALLCRIFKEDGIKVAPFKAQNMALNSFVTKDGAEIGRAQAFQAEAAGLEPFVDMNPILLKPTSDKGSQVIIHGKVYGNMDASEYHKFKKEAMRYVVESYKRLTDRYDVIVIEGAGSPAEINLRAGDIVNMGLAEVVDAPVFLVGDIERGGVFASILGTIELLSPSERRRVKGIIINKFRGDRELLQSGIDFIEERTGVSVTGIIPYFDSIGLPQEDGVSLEDCKVQNAKCKMQEINIAIIKFPRISNFTDFDALAYEKGVIVRYIYKPESLHNTDMVIIPGTKNTLKDLKFLWGSGFAHAIRAFWKKGGRVVGICGGFQMLGKVVKDPYNLESDLKGIKGLGIFNIETVLREKKQTYQIEAVIDHSTIVHNLPFTVSGYEIHMGDTRPLEDVTSFSRIRKRGDCAVNIADGAVSNNGRVWGTYIHGIFDNDLFRHDLLNELRKDKMLSLQKTASFIKRKESNITRLAKEIRANLDMKMVYSVLKQKV